MCARQVILAGTFCMMYVRDFAGKRFDVRRSIECSGEIRLKFNP
jgi:hypothetical protein